MSLRRRTRADTNQKDIVAGLRKCGASVYILDDPIDLLVGYEGLTTLIEVKGPAGPKGGVSMRGLTDAQRDFIGEGKGGGVLIVRSLAAAMLGLGMRSKS